MDRKTYLEQLLNKGLNYYVPRKENQTGTPKKYPQGYFKEKECKFCGKLFQPQSPSEHYCSDYCKRYAYINSYYERNYHITIEEYLNIAEQQDFKCAICHKENFAMGEKHSGVLVVDHDHNTGSIRGLLCHNCNRALGLLQDDINSIQTMLNYLGSVTTIPKGSTA